MLPYNTKHDHDVYTNIYNSPIKWRKLSNNS